MTVAGKYGAITVECLRPVSTEGGSREGQAGYRILDLETGSGIVGEELRQQLEGQVGYLTGSDILPAAKMSALRHRPGV